MLSDWKMLVACLSIGFFIRLVPELLAYPLPIGFDTIYYANVMKDGVIIPHWTAFFTSSWLLNAFTVPSYGVTLIDPFLLLKVVAPLLFGLNVAGIYWFSRKALGWSSAMGLFAGVFFALQLASLRISWDLLRNTLGLGVLLFAFAYVKNVGSKRGFALFVSLSLLSVFAHEYAAVTLLFVVLGLLVWKFAKGQFDRNGKFLVLGVIPALSVFAVGMYLRFFPIRYEVSSNVIQVGDAVGAKVGGLFFLVDYLKVQSSVDSYSSYFSLAMNVGLLFAVLFVPYLYLVFRGFFRNEVLSLWSGLLLIGAFGCLVLPFSAIEYWHRWMFMLAYPLTFFAASGFRRLVGKVQAKEIWRVRLFSSTKAVAMLLFTFVLGIGYLATPVIMVFVDSSVPAISGTSAYFCVAPTVPYKDVNGVVEAVEWLNSNMDENSCVILQHAFLEWGRLHLDESHKIVYFENSPDSCVAKATENGFSQIFFVWWNQPIGWYGVSVPEDFVRVQDFGRISVYCL